MLSRRAKLLSPRQDVQRDAFAQFLGVFGPPNCYFLAFAVFLAAFFVASFRN